MSAYRDEILAAIQGQHGEVRINCPNPECKGGQARTLGVNADNGRFSCFRCGIKGNVKERPDTKTNHEFFWNKAQPVVSHPYLEAKQVGPHGIRRDRYGNLVVPYFQHGQLTTVQQIKPERDEKGKWPKSFLSKKNFPASSIKGSSFVITGDSSTVYIAEGYSTAATIHEVTGATVVVVGYKDNFGPAIESLRYQYSDSQFVFCADNDSHGKGLEAASKAALRLNAKVTMPEKSGQDFNDLFLESGADAVRTQISRFVEPSTVEQNSKPSSTLDYSREQAQRIKERAQAILRDREPAGEFDLTRMPELVRKYVEAICTRTQATTVMVLMSVLGCMSALIGRSAYIPEGTYFQRLYPNVWMLCLAPSGAFKTTALNKGSRLAWQKESEIQKKIRALDTDLASLINESFVGNDKEAKKRSQQIKREKTQLQSQSCILPNRMSGEGLLEMLAEGQAGLIPASEFGDWLDNLAKTHNQGLKPLFTDLYDVPTQYGYKTRGGGYLLIQRPFISISAFSTPDWVQSNISLSDVGSGFFARFLLFAPPQMRSVPPALPEIQEPFDCEAENILKRNMEALSDDHPFGLAPKAAMFFESVHQALYAAMAELSEQEQDLLAPYAKRWSPYILKLAMIFQVAIDPSKDISVEAVKAGAAVVEYAMKSTVHLFKSELGLSQVQRNCQAVVQYIAKRGGAVERHKLMSSRVLSGGAKEYDEILTTLELQNQVEILPSITEQKKFETIRLVAHEKEQFE